ncbi:hypothetical protein, partial [Enterococcus sp. C76]|uniref:hypothetical protein n=1 Tax=Enterococcus sp. C76 TaxID=3231334 RepID=UPI0034A0041A
MSSVLYSMYLKFAEDKIQTMFLHIIFFQILLSVLECGVHYLKSTMFEQDVYISLVKEIGLFLFIFFVLFIGLFLIKKEKR